MVLGPTARITQPDPVLSNVMQDNSRTGGWFSPILCSAKPIAKDYARWSTQDSKALLTNFMETLRAPGARANLIPQAIKSWATSVVSEDAVRSEYTAEDVANSVSPEVPRMNAAMKIQNVLMFALELRVATLYAPANVDADSKTAVSNVWSGSSSRIAYDVERAKEKVALGCGSEANYIRIPRGKWAGIIDSDEVKKNPSGFYNALLAGIPQEFMGLKLLMAGPRYDSTFSGAFSPTWLWDDTTLELDDTIHVGFSPTIAGQSWSGEGNAYAGQFENQLNGVAFQAQEYPDPYGPETGKMIVFGNVRRSLPEVMNTKALFALTGA